MSFCVVYLIDGFKKMETVVVHLSSLSVAEMKSFAAGYVERLAGLEFGTEYKFELVKVVSI